MPDPAETLRQMAGNYAYGIRKLDLEAGARLIDSLRAQADRFEKLMDPIDAAALEHFRAIGKPFPTGTNWWEAASELPEELPRLRAQLTTALAERDALRAAGQSVVAAYWNGLYPTDGALQEAMVALRSTLGP